MLNSLLNSLPIVLLPPDSSLLYSGRYNPVLVLFSVAIAVFAAYASLLVSQRVAAARTARERRVWTAVGGGCMGAGIWAMHFVGMLAFSLPCTTRYDPLVTLFSAIPGFLASVLAMSLISRPAISPRRLAAGGTLFGAGIGTMHYAGMSAYRLDGLILYDLKLFLLSLLVAVALAILAIRIKFRLQSHRPGHRALALPAGALVMGLAVSGMHYTAMAAAYFVSGEAASSAGPAVAPEFLATTVLVVTSGIIVVTLVAVFMERPQIRSFRGIHRWTAVTLAAWIVIAWAGSGYYSGQQSDLAYGDALLQAREEVEEIADHIDDSLRTLRGVPLILAKDLSVQAVLQRAGPEVAPSALPTEERRRAWSADPMLARLNDYLALVAAGLDVNAILVVNAAGDCLASSNADDSVSFVGSNFSYRAYFLEAREGRPGRQYALGKVSNEPGIFYSSPVVDEGGKFLGAVVVKRDLSELVRWTRPAGAFIVDGYGVIVQASEPVLLFRAMPDAVAADLPSEERMQLYGRETLPPLEILPWQGGRFPQTFELWGLSTPVILVSSAIEDWGLSVKVPYRLSEVVRLEQRRPWLFLLIAVTGALVVLSAITLMLYLRANREAREMAESASRAKSTFLANMSHELRTPLNGILGYAQIMQRDPLLPESHRNGVDIIRRSGDHLLTLINEILDLAKIEAGRFSLLFAPCNLQPLLRGVAELFRIRAREKGIDFECDISPTLPVAVESDEKRLRQILFNLLGNAVKFTEQGKVTLHAAFRAGILRLEVSDTGVGMPRECISEIFHPFQQIGTQEYRYQGTGLGLSITGSLVEQMKGTIKVESEPGIGSRFRVEIPLKVLNSSPEPAHTPPAAATGYRRTDGGSGAFRILMVDDVAADRDLLRRLLAPLGFALEEAVDGETAIETAGRNPPDLILMDLMMPGLDGFATTRRLQAEPRLSKIPVVACSAGAYAADRESTRQAGCVEHIAKPVQTEALFAVLERNLALEWVRESTAARPQVPPAAGRGLSDDERSLLLDLAKRGNVRRLRMQLMELGDAVDHEVVRLREMVGVFDLKGARALLEQREE